MRTVAGMTDGAGVRSAAEFGVALAAVLIVVALGGMAVVYGEADDSPGLQGIGVLMVIAAVVWALRWRTSGGRGRRAVADAGDELRPRGDEHR
ncbi:hypothetical protein [Dietzia cinnamea]|uniref:Uncharacterized protein n=1 Tax=Dietzia cinnamea TaxID=321318 RepID=A0A4R3ZT66_9ACTN|nr:hypothetical protein [Dietzia cinnamea]TCW23501.1 hypothetical protein EDD19_11262 [Dietzia cinnamea]